MTLSSNFSLLFTCITCFQIWRRVVWQLTELRLFKINILLFLLRNCDSINSCCNLKIVNNCLRWKHFYNFILNYRYAHGSDLCHDLELRHAMANCFEALMGALFLDGDIEVADKVFSNTLFMNEKDLLDVWINYPLHPLQEQVNNQTMFAILN